MNDRIPWRFTPIPVDLDSYGLDPYAYRILTHLLRRRTCYASLKNIAALCRMSVRQVQHALKTLEANEMVVKKVRRGKTNIYTPTSPGSWKLPEYFIDEEKADAQDYFNRALLLRERENFQGALADLLRSLDLYEQELSKARRQGKATARREQDIRDTENEIRRLVDKRIAELNLDDKMNERIERINNNCSNSSEDDSDDF